jgi:hypothetical protein
MDIFYEGTEIKLAIEITSEGFDMNKDPWSVTVKCGKRAVKCTEDNGANSVNGQWYLTVNTAELGKGIYYLIAEIDVPDAHFSDGYRHEVLKDESPLCEVRRT